MKQLHLAAKPKEERKAKAGAPATKGAPAKAKSSRDAGATTLFRVAGVTAIDTSAGAVTVRVVELITEPKVAPIVVLPCPWLDASPLLFIVTTLRAEELHVTALLTSRELLFTLPCSKWPVPDIILQSSQHAAPDTARAQALSVESRNYE